MKSETGSLRVKARVKDKIKNMNKAVFDAITPAIEDDIFMEKQKTVDRTSGKN
jgi:hypothetical protein